MVHQIAEVAMAEVAALHRLALTTALALAHQMAAATHLLDMMAQAHAPMVLG